MALWSHDRRLRLHTTVNGSWVSYIGEESAVTRDCIESQRLDVMLATIPSSRPLIIKFDIEGAERKMVESCPDVITQAQCIWSSPTISCA